MNATGKREGYDVKQGGRNKRLAQTFRYSESISVVRKTFYFMCAPLRLYAHVCWIGLGG